MRPMRPTRPAALTLALAAAALALLRATASGAANCCSSPPQSGDFEYGTNTFSFGGGCTVEAWLEPQHDVQGGSPCGCETSHEPHDAFTCCGEAASVEWTKECVDAGDSITVFTGTVRTNGLLAGTLKLAGRVIRPKGGCSSCGGGDAPDRHGRAESALPLLRHVLMLGPDSGFLMIDAREPSADLATPAGLGLVRGDEGVDLVCQGEPPAPRQVLSKSGLADIVTESATAFDPITVAEECLLSIRKRL